MSFLPEGYEVPSTGGSYMKLKVGESRFRFLSEPILGFIRWVEVDGGRKPERIPMKGTFDSKKNSAKDDVPKHFWAMIVLDYSDNKIKILEITQQKVLRSLQGFIANPKWGDPREYDVVVTGEGEGKARTYTVMPEPKEKLSADILKQYKELNINLEALFIGDDPFNPTKGGVATTEEVESIFGE